VVESWETIFFFGRSTFRGLMLVLGRVMQQISKNSAAWKLKQFDPNFPICGPLPLPSVTRWLTLRPLDTKPEASTLNFSTIQPALHVATRRPVLEKNSDVVNIHNHIHICTEVFDVPSAAIFRYLSLAQFPASILPPSTSYRQNNSGVGLEGLLQAS